MRTYVDICTVLRECAHMQDMGRTRTPTNITIDPDVLAAVDRWVANAEPRTTRSAFFEMAAKHFLAAEEKVVKERREK